MTVEINARLMVSAVAVAVFGLGSGGSAHAIDPAGSSVSVPPLSDDATDQISIVVTGQKATADATHLDANPIDLPIAIQVVPIGVIQDQGVIRFGDALRNISGVTRKEAYFGLTDSFNIRGFDASTGLFNGFRHDYYGTVVDLAHVDSVEVIKGPSSVTTGFLEPGGVVNVLTKRPTADSLTAFDLSGGSYGRVRLQGDISRRLSDTLSVRLTGAVERTNSFRDYVRSKRATIGAAVDWKPTSTTKVELSGYYEKLHAVPDRGLPNDPISFQLPRSRFFGEPTDRYHLNEYESSAVVTQQVSEGISLRAGFDWSRTADLRRNTQAIALQPDGRTFTRDYTVVPGAFDTKTAFAEAHAAFDTFGLSHKIMAGVDSTRQEQTYDFFDTDVSANPDSVPTLDIFDPVYGVLSAPPAVASDGNFRGVTKDIGLYANDVVALGKFKLLVGIRNDRFRYHDHDKDYDTTTRFHQSATTPRIGLVYQPVPTVSIYANYARSFNPQQFTRLANGDTPAPSRGEQEEIGVKYQSQDGRWAASLAGYQIHKTNVATTDPNDPTGTFSILSGEERSRGVELDLSARPIDGLQAIVAFTRMHAIVTSDEMIPVGDGLVNVPRTQATFWARYDFPGTPFGVGGSVYYVGRREATLPNSFTLPAYTRFDAAIFWKATSRVELAINVQNLTDKVYYDSQDNSFFPGTPRSVLATLRTHF